MIILTIRGDNPEAEVGLFDDTEKLAYEKWQAHRQLAETIHLKIKKLLDSHKITWSDIDGIICYKGPGSFTGLRISISVANAIAFQNNIPIVGTNGSDWTIDGIDTLMNNENDELVLPEYGAPVHITKPRK